MRMRCPGAGCWRKLFCGGMEFIVLETRGAYIAGGRTEKAKHGEIAEYPKKRAGEVVG